MKRTPIALLLAASALTATAHAAPTPKQTPPPVAPPKPLTPPKLAERTLPNGVRVIVAARPGTGLVSVSLLVRGAGGTADPGSKSGLADTTASLLNKGTTTRTAPQIANAIESLGGSLSAGAGWDAATISLSVMRTRLDAALPILADVALRPSFPAAELERQRSQTLDGLSVELQEPGTLARYAASRVLYGAYAYGHPLGGTPTSLKRITRSDVQRFFQTTYQPKNAILVFGGDITPATAYALASKSLRLLETERPSSPGYFSGSYHHLSEGDIVYYGDPAPSRRRIVVIDKADAGQSAVEITRLGIARNDSDYYTAQLANAILGGGYSSRLNFEVRVKRGLSYGAGSSLDARLLRGPFVASCQTKNESAPEVSALLLSETGRLATAPLLPAELASRKLTLIGDFNRGIETGAGLSSSAARLALYGVPLSALGKFPDRIRAVTAAQVKAFAAKDLSPKSASLIVVGNAAQFLPGLKKQFPGEPIQVIPFAKVSFDSPTLTRP